MAYDEELANRTRTVLGERADFREIAMFGGICFTVNGNMVLGVVRDDLMVRVGAAQHAKAMAKPGARPMDFTKRPMEGFLFAGPEGTKTARALGAWADMALAYVQTLPPKKPKKPRAPKKKVAKRSGR